MLDITVEQATVYLKYTHKKKINKKSNVVYFSFRLCPGGEGSVMGCG